MPETVPKGATAVENRFSVKQIIDLILNKRYEDFAFRDGYAHILTRQAGEIIIEAPDGQIPNQTRATVIEVLNRLDQCRKKAYGWIGKFRGGPAFANGFRLCGICFGQFLHHDSSYTSDGFTMTFEPNASSPFRYTVKFFSNRHPIEVEEWTAPHDESQDAAEPAESCTQAQPAQITAQTLPPWDFTPHPEEEVVSFLKNGNLKAFRYCQGEYLIDCQNAGEICIEAPDGRIPDAAKSLIYDVLDHLDECAETAGEWLKHCITNENLGKFDCEYELGGFCFGRFRFGHDPALQIGGFSVWFAPTDGYPLAFTVKFTRNRQPFAIEQWIC